MNCVDTANHTLQWSSEFFYCLWLLRDFYNVLISCLQHNLATCTFAQPRLSTSLDCWTSNYSIYCALGRRKKYRQIVRICMLQFLSFVVGVVYFLAVSVIGSCDKNTKPCKLERVRDDFEKEARQAWASHRSLDLRPRKLKDVSFGLCHLLFRFWT